jgi:hypothetical protein
MKERIWLGAVVLLVSGSVLAQAPPPIPRIPTLPAATPVPTVAPAPGPELGPWEQFMSHYYDVVKVEKKWIIRHPDGTVWPHRFVKSYMEIVQEDDEYVWLRNLPLEDERSSSHEAWLEHEYSQIRAEDRIADLQKRFVLNPDEVVPPPAFTDRLTLVERPSGLPDTGQWQTGLAIADVNGDRRPDLIVPPARGQMAPPNLFLQKPDGSFGFARAEWPTDVPWDYGDVAAADFDGDGVLDLAFAIHFKPSYVVHGVKGSGGRRYDRPVRLPLAGGGKITSRAFALGDFNRDRRPDIAVLAELDLDMATNLNLNTGLVSVLLNEPDGWRAVDLGAVRVYGDHVVVADFDGNGWDDVLVAKNTNHDTPFLFFNRDKGERWQGGDVSGLPWMPYVFGVAAVSGAKGPADVALAAMQSVRWEGVQRQINFVAVATVDPEGRLAQQVELARFESQVYLSAAAAGDLDGDKRSDVVVGDIRGGVRIFLNRRDGWLEERSPELQLPKARISCLEVGDFDRDGRPELLVEATTGAEEGFIKVFSVAPARPGGVASGVKGR